MLCTPAGRTTDRTTSSQLGERCVGRDVSVTLSIIYSAVFFPLLRFSPGRYRTGPRQYGKNRFVMFLHAPLPSEIRESVKYGRAGGRTSISSDSSEVAKQDVGPLTD